MDLNLVRLILTLRLEGDIADRYALFGMRPHFEEAFRRAASCGRDAGHCTRGVGCAYHQTFSQPLTADPAALRRFQKPSLPFVFSLPLLPDPPNEGDEVEVSLVLAGSAANFVTDYIAALEGMLVIPAFRRRFSASLMKVESAGYDGYRTLVMAPGKEVAMDRVATLSLQGLPECAAHARDMVTVSIVTPMLILREGSPLREFPFSFFMRALFRRVSSMTYYYGGGESELDYRWLAGETHAVACVESEFRWVEWSRKWCGIVGEGTFRGDLTDFLPFLCGGEYLHVGKGATFGLGRYILG